MSSLLAFLFISSAESEIGTGINFKPFIILFLISK